MVIEALVRFQDENVIDFGYNLLAQLMRDNHGNIPVTQGGRIDHTFSHHLASPMLKAALAKFDENLYTELLSIYQACDSWQKSTILEAFDTLYFNANLTENAYAFILNEVENERKVQGLGHLATCTNLELVWDRLEFDGVLNEVYLNGQRFSILQLIEIPIELMSQDKQGRVRDFYVANADLMEKYGESVNSMLEQMESNLVWKTENEAEMNAFLQSYVESSNELFLHLLMEMVNDLGESHTANMLIELYYHNSMARRDITRIVMQNESMKINTEVLLDIVATIVAKYEA